MTFVVTTAVKTTVEQISDAKNIAKQFDVQYVERHKYTVKQLLMKYSTVLVIYKEKEEVYFSNGTRLFFHPNTAMVRIKSQNDPLAKLVGQGKIVLDATLGLACDALVIADNGNSIFGIEKNPLIYFIVCRGLSRLHQIDKIFIELNERIKLMNADHVLWLQQMPEKSVDIVYLDPMFTHEITESKNIDGIKQLEQPKSITENVIMHAKRVAKEKVIIKAHYLDTIFERLGFERMIRKTAKFHYGVIHLTDSSYRK